MRASAPFSACGPGMDVAATELPHATVSGGLHPRGAHCATGERFLPRPAMPPTGNRQRRKVLLYFRSASPVCASGNPFPEAAKYWSGYFAPVPQSENPQIKRRIDATGIESKVHAVFLSDPHNSLRSTWGVTESRHYCDELSTLVRIHAVTRVFFCCARPTIEVRNPTKNHIFVFAVL
ncbi:MAG TPA: hypothetical protein VGN52_21130 [Burkholderiales bacterium]